MACREDATITEIKIVPLDAFEKIELNSAFEVVLVQDTTYFVQINADEELMGEISIKNDHKNLSIINNKRLKWTSPASNIPKLFIHSADFKEVHANESCNITSANAITGKEFGLILKDKANYADIQLDCDVFFYWNNFPCGGKLTLRGRTRELKIWNTAIMSVDAKNLITDYALVDNESKGKCEVNVTNKLEYSIKGKGDIHVYGNPPEVVEQEKSASGKLVMF